MADSAQTLTQHYLRASLLNPRSRCGGFATRAWPHDAQQSVRKREEKHRPRGCPRGASMLTLDCRAARAKIGPMGWLHFDGGPVALRRRAVVASIRDSTLRECYRSFSRAGRSVRIRVAMFWGNSATGNLTRVFRVTGGNTNHYTVADLKSCVCNYSYNVASCD